MDTPSEHIFKVTSDPPFKQFARNFTPRTPAVLPMNRDPDHPLLDQPITIFYKPRDRFGRPYFTDQQGGSGPVKLFTVTDTEADFVDFLQTFIRTENVTDSNLPDPREVYRLSLIHI